MTSRILLFAKQRRHSLDYPPLPESGNNDDSAYAQQEFSEREQASKSWRRLLPTHKSKVTLLKRRNSLLSLNSSSSDSSSIKPGTASHVADESLQDASSAMVETRSSRRVSNIKLEDYNEVDPTKDQHLYRWVMVYENQRGFSLFSTPKYSSQSLLPKDPPPFSVVSPARSLVDGRPVDKLRKSNQPNVSLSDFPLPDGNWRWASKDWMIDMRNDSLQYDGFEYNWYFQTKRWRPRAGRLNYGGWVRRRRWIRLMERPPLTFLKKEKEYEAEQDTSKSLYRSQLMADEVWLGDEKDWTRLHKFLLSLGRDGRVLETWGDWLTYGNYNQPMRTNITRVFCAHASDILGLLTYPASRVSLLALFYRAQLITKPELVNLINDAKCSIDTSQLMDLIG